MKANFLLLEATIRHRVIKSETHRYLSRTSNDLPQTRMVPSFPKRYAEGGPDKIANDSALNLNQIVKVPKYGQFHMHGQQVEQTVGNAALQSLASADGVQRQAAKQLNKRGEKNNFNNSKMYLGWRLDMLMQLIGLVKLQ